MPADSSFDVVSKIDHQEMVNAVDQVSREISTRFDLKNTDSSVTLEKDRVVLACDTEFTLKAVRDILIERSAKRGFSTKVFDFGKVEPAAKGTVRQTAKLRQPGQDDQQAGPRPVPEAEGAGAGRRRARVRQLEGYAPGGHEAAPRAGLRGAAPVQQLPLKCSLVSKDILHPPLTFGFGHHLRRGSTLAQPLFAAPALALVRQGSSVHPISGGSRLRAGFQMASVEHV
jgi:hypothetical protein